MIKLYEICLTDTKITCSLIVNRKFTNTVVEFLFSDLTYSTVKSANNEFTSTVVQFLFDRYNILPIQKHLGEKVINYMCSKEHNHVE